MKGIETGGGSGKPRKPKRVAPPKGKGPLAPKPSGVFAAPVKAPTVRQPVVKARPVAKAKPARPPRTASALDVLPKSKGQPAKPYKPAPAAKVVAKVRVAKAKAQHEARDTKGNADRQVAASYLAAHPEILHPPKPSEHHGSLIGTITAGADIAKKVAPIAAIAPYGAAKGLDAVTGSHVAKFMSDTVKNVPADTAEIVTTTPTSLVKLGDTAIHHPEKVPGMLAQPYKDLIKDPLGTIKEHPVSTALMVAPAGKIPGRVLGKGLRVAGKQSLEHAPATLVGTALKETRPASRDAVVNSIQKRKLKKKPSTELTKADIQRRVDEFHDFAQQKGQQIQGSAHRTAKEQAKALPKDERKAHIAEHVEGARAGSRRTIDQRFVKEFGSTYQRGPTGAILKPKNATEGHLHATRADADAVAAAIKANPKIKWEPHVMQAGEKFGVVPMDAKLRLNKHRAVGTSPATMAKVMRRSRGALTQAVLPLSTKWLLGQGVEAGVRSAAAGAGPADLLRFNKVVSKLNAAKAGSGDELLMRVSGGQFGLTGTAREFAQGQRSLADEFAGTSMEKVGNAATRAGNVLPARAVRKGWGKYTRVVMDSVNGALEQNARKAMAGQAIKNTLLDKHVMTGLTDKALEDAAKGLTGTDSQVQLARAVDRMYGQYQKFSPDKRSLLLHWTPFLPWYLNTAKFLFKVLPGDHPIKTALVADVGVATEQWRKDHGLSLRGGATKPSWMLGGYPTKTGVVPVGRFTPFGAGTDVPGAISSLTLPQLLGPIKNGGGVDWKWQELKNPGYNGKPFTPSQKALRATLTAIESQVPGVTQVARLTGAERKYVDRKTQGQTTAKQSLIKMLNPLAPIPNTGVGATVAPVKGGKAGKLPAGVSQRELDQLVKDAQSQARQPQVSQAEIDALLKSVR